MKKTLNPFFINNRKKGFTLMEVLVVVAILVAVLAVTLGGVTALQRSMRQKELDSKAEIIYVSVQNRLTELRSAGYDSLYTPTATDGDKGIHAVDFISDSEESGSEGEEGEAAAQKQDIYYVYSEDKEQENMAAAAMLPKSAVDTELWEDHWLIEYSPTTGAVYAVFYSEEPIEQDEVYRNRMRFKEGRLSDGAKVGYYGGDITRINFTETLAPSIDIVNEEKLTVKFQCNSPDGGPLAFEITIIDQITEEAYTRTVGREDMERLSATGYQYTWVLDSLEPGKGFTEQTGLAGGNDITIRMTARSVNNHLIGEKDFERTTNSLFADPVFNWQKTRDTAYIAYGRHLQNLSRSGDTITKAVLVGDISFRDDKAHQDDFYSTYGTDLFEPINNPKLKSFNGQYTDNGGKENQSIIDGLHVEGAKSNSGLFDTFAGTISNVTLTGTRIEGGANAGGLIGRITGEVTVERCMLFLSNRQGDLSDLEPVSDPSQVTPWLKGNIAGGLVGAVAAGGSLTMTDSMAATVIRGEKYAGGLVGTVSGTLKLTGCYSDCYLISESTGGITGGINTKATVTLQDFYVVGYQVASKKAAGLAPGIIATAKNGYTAVDYRFDGSIMTTGAQVGTAENLYYLSGELSGEKQFSHAEGSKPVSATDLQNGAPKLSDAFQMSQTAQPYNLMNQGLAYYSYPKLKLEHYGDWDVAPDQEALVYYEVYEDESIGFYGANMTTLRSGKTVVGDGYGLLMATQPTGTWSKTVVYEDNTRETLLGTNAKAVQGNGTTYYMIPLKSMNRRPDYSQFYQKVVIGDETYYYSPYFAKTVAMDTERPETPQVIYLRTPWHLFSLSSLYPYFSEATKNSTFRQEENIDYSVYQWQTYTPYSDISSQKPVGTKEAPFQAVYEGGYHTVSGLDIESRKQELYVGFFGYIAKTGSVKNLFLTGNDSNTITNITSPLTGSKSRLYMGGLVGLNEGRIENCAVSGYQMTQYGYSNSAMYLGGLAGCNRGSILDCSVDAPKITLSNDKSTSTVGGFLGVNNGSVADSYAFGFVEVLETKNSTVTVGGFAGENDSYINRCYSGTAVTSSGEVAVYGFCPNYPGRAINCFYLDKGTYSYRDALYSFNNSTNDYAEEAAGTPVSQEELERLHIGSFGRASGYPYPAIVKNAAGQRIHYGQYASQEKDLGNLGVFYWEYESGGSNAGYHFYFVGTNEGEIVEGSSLCQAHDDGGVITGYGYGYFRKGNMLKDDVTLTVGADCELGEEYKTASDAMKAQLPEYEFVAYKTGDKDSGGMYLTSRNANTTWTLEYNGGTYAYTLCPFFAGAISLDQIITEDTKADKPGSRNNPYQIRAVHQLQNINWNYKKLSAKTAMHQFNTKNQDGKAWGEESCGGYSYLVCSTVNNTGPEGLVWNQSHDLDANQERTGNFTPIGSFMETKIGNTDDSRPVMAYFAGTYDGKAYAIKNVEICTKAEMVGLFGITVGADMKNIVLYSNMGNTISNESDGNDWYCLGGLVGFAAQGYGTASFTNCTVSGYKIIDRRGTDSGWGGGCVGGLVGATNMDINRCSAVTDITLAITYKIGYKNLRVGGIAGVCRGTVESCYAGGSIVSPKKNQSHSNNQFHDSTSIWVGGLVGGIVMRNKGDLQSLVGDVNRQSYVKNSYSYVEMPAWSNDTWIQGSYSIASNGEMQNSHFILVENPTIIIENCYALEDAVLLAEDYKHRYNGQADKDKINWSNWNVNAWDGARYQERAIWFKNDRCPYLTYGEMKETLGTYLSGFGTVTTIQNGAGISGKYSYPGSDIELRNLNYPFPTVLTQTDVFGSTVNVHYGRWPKFGVYWDENTTTVDLLKDRTTMRIQSAQEPTIMEQPLAPAAVTEVPEVQTLEPAATGETDPPATAGGSPAVTAATDIPATDIPATGFPEEGQTTVQHSGAFTTRRLHIYSVTGYSFTESNAAQVRFTYTDEEGNLLEEDAQVAKVVECKPGDNYYEVKIQGLQKGTGVIQAAISHGGKEYTCTMTITVTAELKLLISETKVELYENDSQNLTLSLKDQNGAEVIPGEGETLSYQVMVQNTSTGSAVASAQYDEESQALVITGLSTGDKTTEVIASVTAVYTPTWGQPITASSIIVVAVKPSVHLGITDGLSYNQVSIPHVPQKTTKPQEGKELTEGPLVHEEEGAQGHTLWLYSTKDYVDLNHLYVKEITLSIGGTTYTLKDAYGDTNEEDKKEITYQDEGKNHTVTLGEILDAKDGTFNFRCVTLNQQPEEQWNLDLVFGRRDASGKDVAGTFKLHYKRFNMITFMSGPATDPGTALLALKLPQGNSWAAIGVEQEDLNTKLAALIGAEGNLQPGQRWVWKLPEAGSVVGNIVVYRGSSPICYTISFDGNYDGWDMDGNSMDSLTLEYGKTQNLPDSAYHREGYTFQGWAETPEGSVVYTSGTAVSNLTWEHGKRITLYAVWQKNDDPQAEPSTGSPGSGQGSAQEPGSLQEPESSLEPESILEPASNLEGTEAGSTEE